MRFLLAQTLVLALTAGVATPAAAAPPDGQRRRAPEEAGVRARDEPGRERVGETRDARPGDDERRGVQPAPGGDAPRPGRERFGRRGIEGASSPTPAVASARELHVELRDAGGCPLTGYPLLVRRLLALKNESQLMSLEVWGDAHEYAPYQEVTYYLRSPRRVFVTLYWIGPDGDIYVPFSNLRVPANRDVSVDADSIIVPPLGREQWVAIATLEPLPRPCGLSETQLLGVAAGLRGMPYAIGRWEVRSKTSPPTDRTRAPR